MIKEIRCSQLARPMVCAGFLFFEDLPVQPTNAAAEEGTAFGELVQRMLLGRDIPKQAANGVYFDDDMRFYAKPAVEEVLNNKESEVLCEQRIDWQTSSGIWIRGSFDRSFVREGRLYIDDDKYGWGIVEVRNNWQLIGYAIGEVIRRQQHFETIVLRIHQPRPHHEDGHLREWRLSYTELLGFKKQIEERMEMIAAGHKTLVTGKQCKYCSASAEACPAFNRLYYRAAEVSTEFTQDQINEQELAKQLDQTARFKEALDIKLRSLEELAVSRIKGGKIVPGWITQGSYGNREWKKGISPEVIETLTGRKVTETVMLSPAKVEKLGVHKNFVAGLTERFFKGEKLIKKDAGEIGEKIFGKTINQ